MADGPARLARQPGELGKHAHGAEVGVQQGEVAKRQPETPQANKIVADSYVSGVLGTAFPCGKWWRLYVIFAELESYFLLCRHNK
jgi:hypothetical protein